MSLIQIVDEQKGEARITRFGELETLGAKQLGFNVITLLIEEINLIGHVFKATRDECLKFNSAHVFEFVDEIGVFGVVH